jgi:hypothetical protein
MKSFKLIGLKRTENSHGWVYGQIYYEKKFICDTLELECLELIEPGTYSLSLDFDKDSLTRYFSVINENGDMCSKFVMKNTEKGQKSEIRCNNNYISVGAKATQALLVMPEFAFRQLLEIWTICERQNIELKLYVKNNWYE